MARLIFAERARRRGGNQAGQTKQQQPDDQRHWSAGLRPGPLRVRLGFAPGRRPALRHEHFTDQQNNRQCQRPVITLQRTLHQFLLRVGFRERRDAFLIKHVHRVRAAQRQVETAFGRAGDLLQQRLVQMRLHHVAIFVAHVVGLSFRVFDAQEFAFHRADADGEDHHPGLLCRFRRRQRVLVVIFAVGEQHDHLVIVAFLKRLGRRLNRLANRRAAFGDDVHIQRVQTLAERGVINRQRALQKRAPGKRHQAEPVGLRLLHQIQRGQFRARQAVRRDVLGEHGLGCVNCHHDVQTALGNLLPVKAPLQPGQGDE